MKKLNHSEDDKISKKRKKSEIIHIYSDKLTNQFWLQKITLPVFLLNIFFFLLIC